MQPVDQDEQQIGSQTYCEYVNGCVDIPTEPFGELFEHNDGRITRANEEHIHISADSKLHDAVQGKGHAAEKGEDPSRRSIVALLVAASLGHAEEQSHKHQQHVPHARVGGKEQVAMKQAGRLGKGNGSSQEIIQHHEAIQCPTQFSQLQPRNNQAQIHWDAAQLEWELAPVIGAVRDHIVAEELLKYFRQRQYQTAGKQDIIPAKEESPQDQEKKKNLRVAAYCRVSTKKDEQLGSYENQKAYYTEKIMANPNWTMADIFADEGITGTSACKRKNFLRMIRQCRKGKIDMIFAKSVSRFARNTVDTLSYTRELRSMGIPVLFEEQNINSIYPESEFLITIHGAFAQSESEGISSRVKWGKHQAMRTGKANIQYKTLLGYEKGPDGEMVVNAEQAETVRKIYELYLSGQTLRNIKETLETGGFKNSAGTTEWTTSNLRTILSDEKYCGDVLLQKTFIRDCISKKVIKNTGQLPMYLIQNHHEAIIPRERFDAVQIELARRRAQTGGTKKSAPTGMSRYSGKYALSGLLFCGKCGTAYRRVVWTQHGEKRAVWRCSSRLDYGKKYCKESPTLDEVPLQQAVLAAINASMSGRKVLADQLVDAMEQELAPVPGESMSLGDIDRAVTELGKQFDTLLAEAANGDADEYAERFRAISTTMEELKRRKTAILSIRQEEEQISRRIHAAASAMAAATVGITEWDDGVVYQMLEKVTVLAGNRIKVTFRNGVEIEQTVDQPKRRKFA